jgi:hypothetical protein
MLEEIKQQYNEYRKSLTDYIQNLMDGMAGLRFTEPEYISFLFPDVNCIEELELTGIDEDGFILGIFEYPDGDQEEDIHLNMFLVEQLLDLIEILEKYEVSVG